MAELKPCPFCGGEAKMKFGNPSQQKQNQKSVFIQCKTCKAKTETIRQMPYEAWEDCKETAINSWNRRATI